MKKSIPTLLLLSLFITTISCGKDEFVLPGAEMVNSANNYYARERFDQATDSYRKFIDENPDSPYRKNAILGLADSMYKEKRYFEASLYYERFIELYPLDGLTPRSLFYMGMCHYNDSGTPDRDQTPTNKAIETLSLFLKKYPDHKLAVLAKKFIAEKASVLAESSMEVARFYHRVNKNQAAIGRLREYLAKYPGTRQAPEAMFLLGDCYYREQAYKMAAKIFAAVIQTHPKSKYAAKAAALSVTLAIKK